MKDSLFEKIYETNVAFSGKNLGLYMYYEPWVSTEKTEKLRSRSEEIPSFYIKPFWMYIALLFIIF